LRRLQREDRQPRVAHPQARNTAELLARYQSQGVSTQGSSRIVRQSEPVEEELSTQRSTRAFGVSSFSKMQNNGYQKLGS
jgi:hypothetical protein